MIIKKNLTGILALALVMIGSYFAGHILITNYDNYRKYVIEKDLTTGMPAYFGTCPDVVKYINTALAEDRYLSQHLSANGQENLNFYKTNILGYINGSFSFAQNCQDPEALGRLLYASANITLDLAIDKAMTYKEAVFLAKSYFEQAKMTGYASTHPTETMFLEYRIKRNQFRLDNNANV